MAVQTDALAQVYARSQFELAEQAGGQDKILEVADELEQICELARADRAFREFLSTPIIDLEHRSAALRKIFENRVTDLTLRFLLVLNNKGRLRHLEAINAAYDHLVQQAFGRVEIDVYTPAPLGEEQLATIGDRIRTALGKEPVLHSYADPAMLGGIKLRIGDRLIDGSVANRLRRLRSELLSSGGTAVRERIAEFIEGEES